MVRMILNIFEFFKTHVLLRWTSLTALTIVLVLSLSVQSYKEDISDFLPLENEQQQTFLEYQNNSSARRIFVIFQGSDDLQAALESYCEELERSDSTKALEYMTGDDPEVIQNALNAIYARIPYLLTKEDYCRIDSLLVDPNYITKQLENDKQLMILPTAGIFAQQIQHDPLNLFLPVLERIKPTENTNQKTLLIDSPYGASETEHNTQLVALLRNICDRVKRDYPAIDVHLTGGPVIAVGNAEQIKKDSIYSIGLATLLILLLLWLAFHNVRNLLLIALSIGWGWLFALGCLTLIHNEVSIIVIGISSVILGIAVNYPLHLIAHLYHTNNIRSALKEIVMPLVVGNITTVGAFMALVPLKSVALRDLGLFSAFLLIGTILFVLLWLPHMVYITPKVIDNRFNRIGDVKLENKKWLVYAVIVITIVLGYFSLQTTFDADLRNINYMTDEQKQDMRYLDQFSNYQSQDSDLKQWEEWRTNRGELLCNQLKAASASAGFTDNSFDEFYNLIQAQPKDEVQSLTSTIVNNLSDNFNYIGWACGFIVFVFLWFSLGTIELAILSFLPMAISWVWILGIMSLFGIQFNVVNIILATFIFGQGDDYTIFMTEGCQYEYAYRRKMLSSYKYSIIISALIMFVGIGALIIAKHPALYSLAKVTIIGMFSVVLMAYLFPPLIFRWLVYSKGKERLQPITIINLIQRKNLNSATFVSNCYRYRGVEIKSSVNRRLRRYKSKGYFQRIEEQILPSTKNVIFINSGWGEVVLYYALKMPNVNFISVERDHDKSHVANNVAEGRVSNITFCEEFCFDAFKNGIESKEVQTILLNPSEKDVADYSFLKPTIVK